MMGKAFVSGGANMKAPVGGTSLSTVSVGSTVLLNEDGVAKEYLVIHQGLPSSVYDASCDGIWLLRKNAAENRPWNNARSSYADSDIHEYLNSTFLNKFDSNIQTAIKQVKIPHHTPIYSGVGTVLNGADGLSTKIFLLSYTEVSFDGTSYGEVSEGVELSYFAGLQNGYADTGDHVPKRVCTYDDGTDCYYWWLRTNTSGVGSDYQTIWFVDSVGAPDYKVCNKEYGIRPALILPSNALLSEDGTIKI